METIQILGIIVLLIGILLIGVEFYVPGFGVPGISGTIFAAAGIYLTGKNTSERIMVGVITIVIVVVMLVMSIFLFSKDFKSPIKLDTDLNGKNIFIEEKDMEYLIGKEGVALTDLRPLGKGEFDGVKFDVVSDNYFIKKGTTLVISEIDNNKIIVKEGM